MRLSWLTGSVLLVLAASTSPVAAQILESFANPTVTNPANFIYGIGAPPPGQPSPDTPCLTAALLQPVPPPTTGNGVPGCHIDTTNAGALPDPVGTGVLRLTPSKTNQASFVLVNQPPLASGNGLIITFDFYTYNGSGGDGISFFLIDARFSPQTAGGFGGSLGYAPRTDTTPPVPGLVGGYVGIGFDAFGGFSNPREGRVGGPGRTPDSVAIRGSQATNYRYLAGTQTLPQGLDRPNATNRIAEGVRRTARIVLTPNNEISVDIDFNDRGFVNVIPQLDLKTVPGQGNLPPFFKFGFAASAGDATNIHEIRDLQLPIDVSITTTGPERFIVGQQGSYTLRVRNSPSANSVTDPVTVTDTLPPGFNFISATGTNWICAAQGSLITCNYAETALPLRQGAVAPPITITVVPTTTASNPSVNTAKVATPGDDPNNPPPRPHKRKLKDNTSTINTRVVKPLPPPLCNRAGNICKF